MPIYPTPPGPKLAWHSDGTQLLRGSASGFSNDYYLQSDFGAEFVASTFDQVSDLIMENLNTPNNSSPLTAGELESVMLLWIFPQKIDILGFYIVSNYDGSFVGYTQPTSGLSDDGILQDFKYSTKNMGTWLGTTFPTATDAYRTEIRSLDIGDPSVTMVSGLFTNSGPPTANLKVYEAQFYGVPVPPVEERLILLDSKMDVITSMIDWEDSRLGEQLSTSFHVKNVSTQEIVSGVEVLAEGQDTGWFLFSKDGRVWDTTVRIGDLAPGAARKFFVRRRIPDSATPGLREHIITFTHEGVS